MVWLKSFYEKQRKCYPEQVLRLIPMILKQTQSTQWIVDKLNLIL